MKDILMIIIVSWPFPFLMTQECIQLVKEEYDFKKAIVMTRKLQQS